MLCKGLQQERNTAAGVQYHLFNNSQSSKFIRQSRAHKQSFDKSNHAGWVAYTNELPEYLH